MAKVLRLHNQGNDNIIDWGQSQGFGNDVISQIKDPDGATCEKEITSIPSPYARIDLAKTAFKIVSDSGKLDGKTIYHKIISDSLDVGQLFFNYEDFNGKLEIIVWDMGKELGILEASETEGHKIIGRTLKMFWNQDSRAYNFDRTGRLYLLNYTGPDRPAPMNIIGATSPSTLFMSSANDLSYASNHLRFGGADKPFDKDYTPLYKRDFEYQKYLYAFRERAGRTEFAGLFPEFSAYMDRSYTCLKNDQKSEIDSLRQNSIDSYPDLTVSGNAVEVVGFRLHGHIKLNPSNLKSDFKIESKIRSGDLPLVLPVDDGNLYTDLKYFINNWQEDYHANYSDETALDKRVLPYTQQRYPYLTIGDFLQPYITSMPYELSSDAFFDGNIKDKFPQEKRSYLLPLTKRFFEFFTVDELTATLQSGEKMIEIKPLAGGCVSVTLRIPIQKGRHIKYERTYLANLPQGAENKGRVIEKRFGLGIMPLIDSYKEMHTHYRVAFFNKVGSVKLSFGKGTAETPAAAHVVRRETAERLCSIESYVLEAPFDRIFVEADSSANVIIPKFRKVSGPGPEKFRFAVDFGTTNTHIEYATANNPNAHVFDISRENRQLRRLHENYVDDKDITVAFEDALIPDTVSEDSGYSFPIRTAFAEKKNIDYRQRTDSLADGNIPFRYEKAVIPSYNTVQTNLKWSSANDSQRVKLYLDNLFFLMRNKVLLEGGSLPETEIRWFYPASMSPARRSQFNVIWQELYAKYFGGNTERNLRIMSESEAPYYYYIKHRGALSNVVTIDIGGGTTDVYVVENREAKILSSFRFASNSIFGDGYNFASSENGFIQTFAEKIKSALETNGLSDINNSFDAIKQKENSNDLIAFFFSLSANKTIRDRKIPLDFMEMLTGDDKLKYVFIVFYGAIFYYVANIMKSRNLALPQTLAFSGNGSKTLRVLSPDNDFIAQYATLVFEEVFEKKYGKDRLEIIFDAEPKLATCKGGIAYSGTNMTFDGIDSLKTSLLGTDNQTLTTGRTYSDIKDAEIEAVAENVSNFVDILFGITKNNNNFFTRTFAADLSVLPQVKTICKSKLVEFTKQGYDKKMKELASWGGDAGNTEIEETMFFFPIVAMLSNLAREIIK